MNRSRHALTGALCAAAAYLMWGLSSLYWKLLANVPPLQLLGLRIVSSVLTLVLVIAAMRKLHSFARAAAKPRVLLLYGAAGLAIALNWGAFMWGSIHGHVIETGLGYLISPLVSIVLGAVCLKEPLSRGRMVAVGLMIIAVINMMLHSGELLPWVFLVIGLSFGSYGLLRKLGGLDPIFGLTLETLILTAGVAMAAFAASGLAHPAADQSYLAHATSGEWWLLVFAGSVSVVPLWLYGMSAKRLSLASLGFFQYILPTTQIVLAYLYYEQVPGLNTMMSFALIWVALMLVMGESVRAVRARRLAMA